MELDEWTASSPDGQWVAEGLVAWPRGAAEQYFTRLTVTRVAGGQTWTAVEVWRPTGLGFTTPELVQWAADGAALYFTNRPHPDGCAVLVTGSDLLRLDLATGAVIELLPDVGRSLALSPDESRVAYVTWGEPRLVVRDVATGTEHAIALDLPAGATAGQPVWAPDGGQVALTVIYNACFGPGPVTHAVWIADPAAGTARVVLAASQRQFVAVDWRAPGEIILDEAATGRWRLDIATGVVEAA
jgi:hypothetical protein